MYNSKATCTTILVLRANLREKQSSTLCIREADKCFSTLKELTTQEYTREHTVLDVSVSSLHAIEYTQQFGTSYAK